MYADASEDPIALNNTLVNMDDSFNATTSISANYFDDQFKNDDPCSLTSTDIRNNIRQAIAAIYQGYCSKLFVLCMRPRKQISCPYTIDTTPNTRGTSTSNEPDESPTFNRNRDQIGRAHV